MTSLVYALVQRYCNVSPCVRTTSINASSSSNDSLWTNVKLFHVSIQLRDIWLPRGIRHRHSLTTGKLVVWKAIVLPLLLLNGLIVEPKRQQIASNHWMKVTAGRRQTTHVERISVIVLSSLEMTVMTMQLLSLVTAMTMMRLVLLLLLLLLLLLSDLVITISFRLFVFSVFVAAALVAVALLARHLAPQRRYHG